LNDLATRNAQPRIPSQLCPANPSHPIEPLGRDFQPSLRPRTSPDVIFFDLVRSVRNF